MEPRYLAILMMGLFLLVVVAGRVAFQFLLVGDSGVRSGTKLKTSKEMMVSFLLFVTLGVQAILTWLYSGSHITRQIDLGIMGMVVGLALCIGGIAFASYSQFGMGRDWRIGVDPDEETKLVTTGIYGRIRNPIYTGCIIHGAGIVLLAPHIFVFITGVIGFFVIRAYVKVIEEPYLVKLHGEKYREYTEQTGSFFPRF